MTEGPGDLDRLFAGCVETAGQMLAKHGEFYPFALAMTVDDRIVSPSVDPGSEHPSSDQVLRLLVTALRQNVEDLRAVALCADVSIPGEDGPRDAVRVELEPAEGDPVTLVVPYAAGPVFEAPFAQAGERRVWRPDVPQPRPTTSF